MNIKKTIKVSLLVLAVLALIILPLGWIFTPGLREPVAVPAPDYWPTDGWQARTAEELGYSSEKLAAILQDLQDEGHAIDSLLIIHNGYVVLDAHFAPYDGSFPHNLASVTKSVTTTLIAIAAEQGYFDLDQTVVSVFPNRTIANLDERKARMTIRDLVSMRNGMESGCITTDMENLDAIRLPSGWVQAALDRPMVADPGTEFCYDSPGFHILSAILQETTGMTELEFARENLFEPLGIRDAIWDTDPQGYNTGWGDLYLSPESAAKIGFLWLQRGNWNGHQIVPEKWVVDSVHPHSHPVDHDYGYGYGWWINNSHYFAAGRGGQEIRVIPSLDTVVVITGGFFDPTEVIGRLTLPVLFSGRPRPADPEGLNLLQETLASIQFNDTLPAVFSSPETAQAVSGRLYVCEENVLGLESARFDFSDPDVAVLYHRSSGEDIVWPIGLDGRYRSLDPDGDGLLGYWEDDQTFHLEIFDLGTQVFLVKFQGDRLQLIANEAGLTVACQVQNP